jgi:hypothetical protein
MTREQYDAIDAVNFSTLKYMRQSPKHYRNALTNPTEDSTTFMFGRAVHASILEPDRFPLDFAVWRGDRRAGKEWEAFKAANAGRTIIKEEEYTAVVAMRNSVRSHPGAGPLLAQGEAERSLAWTDPDTGIKCKARLDWVGGSIVDVKTAVDIDPLRFGATVARYGYHLQAAFYRMAVTNALGLVDMPFHIIAVEKSAPYDVVPYQLDDASLFAGEEEVRGLLAQLKSCREKNEWPGRCEREVMLSLPGWAFTTPTDDDAGELGLTFAA